MKIKIDFSEPIIPQNKVLDIGIMDLDDFYITASDSDKNNLFFMLLTSIHHYEDNGNEMETAHLSFLTAYYLFVALTPPGSIYLALYFIKKAISLNHLAEYDEWLTIIEQGN